eukprot:scaffold31191_cov41-Attheya_sp.AAC.2
MIVGWLVRMVRCCRNPPAGLLECKAGLLLGHGSSRFYRSNIGRTRRLKEAKRTVVADGGASARLRLRLLDSDFGFDFDFDFDPVFDAVVLVDDKVLLLRAAAVVALLF